MTSIGVSMGIGAHAALAPQQVAGFDPLTLSPTAWWDFSDAASITPDTGKVDTINDKSGNGNHLSQSVGGRKPLYTLGGQNGRDVATFDGIDDFMKTDALTRAQSLTVFMVAKVTANTGTQANLFGGTFPSDYLSRSATTGLWSYHGGTTLTTATANDLGVHVFTVTYNGASSLVRIDGSQIHTGNAGTTGLSGNFCIGAYSDTSSPMPGFIGEALICPTPSSTLRGNYEAALKTKWGTP